MEKDHVSVWDGCLEFIQEHVSDKSFSTWFKPIRPAKLTNGSELTIEVPSLFFYEWLEEHYVHLLKQGLRREIGQGATLKYHILVENTSKAKEKTHYMNLPTANRNRKPQEVKVHVPDQTRSVNPFETVTKKRENVDPQLNPRFTFDNFIEGDCNRLARSAGVAIAENPGGTAFNPLFLYGGVGLGKTHLSQAIGHRTRELNVERTVLYVSSETFTNQFIEALRKNSINDFLEFYQQIDLLAVDDVQFFANKGKTQDIFFHIFNHLHQSGKQIVLTSDRPPRDLKGLEERLLSRFKWGLSADLQRPEFETRLAILREKMQEDGIELPEHVVEYVARNVKNSIRELEGALVSLLAHSSLNKAQLTPERVDDILHNIIRKADNTISIDQIQKIVCEYFNVTPVELRSKSRKRHITNARQISIYFAKTLTEMSLSKIGEHFGGRDHSTVIHSFQAVTKKSKKDIAYQKDVDVIRSKIESQL